MMTGKLLGLLIPLVLVVIHDVLAVTEVGNPEILPECSHLSIKEGQFNSFLGSHKAQCCMCGKGTYRAKECSVHNPNSTQCDPCKYDPVKEQWTYINFGPHIEEECLAQPSCLSFLVSVGGSSSSEARCVCPDGTDPVDRFICPPISNVSSKTDTVSPRNVEVDNKVFQSPTATPGPTPTPGSPTYTSSKPPSDFKITSNEPTQKSTESMEVVSKSNPETTEETTFISTNLGSGNVSINQSANGNHTTASAKIGIPPNIGLILATIGSILFVVGFVLFIAYYIGVKYDLIPDTLGVKHDNDKSYIAGKSCEGTEKSSDPLWSGDGQVNIQISTVKEKPGTDNCAVSFNARPGDRIRICGQQSHPADEELGEPDTLLDHADPIDLEAGGATDRHEQVERIPRRRDVLSEQEKRLCYEAFMEMAEAICQTDLCRIGRALLSKRKNAFEDIYDSGAYDRAEKARKIFIRAMELNPKLRLQDILDLVRGLGYLQNIVEEKMAQMRADGDVD